MSGTFTAYVRVWMLTVLACACVISLVNWLVDPYGLFAIPAVEGLNQIKVRAGQRGLLSKTYNLSRLRPKALILGDSRAEVGLDPDHAGWPADARPVYNFALAGGGLSENLRTLRMALDGAPITTVVLGLDFREFVFDAAKAVPQSDKPAPNWIALPTPADWMQSANEQAQALASLDALWDSLLTVSAQRDPYTEQITNLGFNPLRDYIRIVKREGHYALFDQKNHAFATSLAHGGRDIFLPGSQDSPGFQTLGELLRLCRSRNVRLQLVIYPYHAQVLELFMAAGLWDAFEDWKRRLTTLLAEEAAEAGATPYPLWDFSGYNPYTSETVPVSHDVETEMRWYWEGIHFKRELGNLLLDRVFGSGQAVTGYMGEFGTLLTRDGLEDWLMTSRAQAKQYAGSHAEEIARLTRLVATARQSAGPPRTTAAR